MKNITDGTLKSGDFLPSEAELCEKYNVSRNPLRRAMTELVNEDIIVRTRGKGTYIKNGIQQTRNVSSNKNKSIGLITSELNTDFSIDILNGFEKKARKNGYLTIIAKSITLENELAMFDRLIENNVDGIVLFPLKDTKVDNIYKQKCIDNNISLCIIDREINIDNVDYVISDNIGGGYLAARHIKMQGFRNVLYLSNNKNISTINERFNGFHKGIRQYNLNLINTGKSSYIDTEDIYNNICDANDIESCMSTIKNNIPIAVFCENDIVALNIMEQLKNNNLKIGDEVGIIGFDNDSHGKYINPPLTSIAQNGVLMGEISAELVMREIKDTMHIVKHMLPTQLIIRKSCGEDHAKKH